MLNNDETTEPEIVIDWKAREAEERRKALREPLAVFAGLLSAGAFHETARAVTTALGGQVSIGRSLLLAIPAVLAGWYVNRLVQKAR